jgi:hypothetical protein
LIFKKSNKPVNEYLECLEGDVGSNPTRSTFLDTYNKNNMDNNKIRGIISKMIKEELQNEFFGKVTAEEVINGAIFREENKEQIDEFYKLKVLAGIIK